MVCGVNVSLISFSVWCFFWLSVGFVSDPINVFRQECKGIQSGLAVMLLCQSILVLEFILPARCVPFILDANKILGDPGKEVVE